MAAWLVLVGSALVQAAANWSVLTGSVLEKVLAIDNVFLMTLAFVLAKFVHELGHGLATKRWGGEVNEVGITLLVFLPVPYVEASSSTAFPSKWRRAAVGAAGMYFELLLAALAMLVWLRLEPGLYRTFALDTMVVAGISTVLVNANPLLRYDGYFILADLIESPNLAPRSYRCLSDLVQRWAFGVEGIQSMTPAQGETGWLVTYAIASYVCRTVIAALIALFLANQYFVLGAALAIWLCVMSFAVPLVKGARFLAASPRLEGHRTRAWSVTTGVLVVLGGILAIVPVPLATRAEGVVWAPPGAEIATETDGFVKAVLAADGTSVCEGCRLLVLDNPELPTSIALMEARLAALGARYQAERLEDLVKSQVTMQEVEHVRQRLAYDRDRSSRLTLIAAREARWSIASDADLQGRFLRRGTTVGYLYRSDELVIRVIARQEDMGLIRAGIERISIRLPGNIDQELHGTVERMIPSATDKLPSLALATSAGGGASLEPQGTGGSKSLQRYFEIHIKVLGSQRSERFGQRAFVQFVHRDEPLATQWWRRLRQMFLRELSI